MTFVSRRREIRSGSLGNGEIEIFFCRLVSDQRTFEVKSFSKCDEKIAEENESRSRKVPAKLFCWKKRSNERYNEDISERNSEFEQFLYLKYKI